MGIVGTLVRYSIPTGALYWSVVHEVWLPGAGSPEAENRLEIQRRALNESISNLNHWRSSKVDPLIKPYVDPAKLPNLQIIMPDVVQYWNCGVRTVIKSIAEFDARSAGTELIKWSQRAIQQTTNEKTDSKK